MQNNPTQSIDASRSSDVPAAYTVSEAPAPRRKSVYRSSRRLLPRMVAMLLLPAVLIFAAGCEEEGLDELEPSGPTAEEIQAAVDMTRREYQKIMEQRLAAASTQKWSAVVASALLGLVVGMWISNKVRSDLADQRRRRERTRSTPKEMGRGSAC